MGDHVVCSSQVDSRYIHHCILITVEAVVTAVVIAGNFALCKYLGNNNQNRNFVISF